MKEKKGKVIIASMTLVILALICFNGYLLYDKLNNNDNNNNNIDDNTNYLTIVEGHSVQVENKDAKIISKNDDYVLYYDKGLMLYNLRNKSIEKIDIEYGKNLSFNIIIDSDTYIAYYDVRCFEDTNIEKNSGIYNTKTKEVSFKNQYSAYTSASNGDSSMWSSGYVVAYEYSKTEKEFVAKVINLEEMKVIVSYDYGHGVDEAVNYDINATIYQYQDNKQQTEKELIVLYTYGTGGDWGIRDNYVIYDNTGKVIDKIKDNEFVDFVYTSEVDLEIHKYTKDSSSKIFDSE